MVAGDRIMNGKEVTAEARQAALKNGADLVGVVRVEDLPEHSDRIRK